MKERTKGYVAGLATAILAVGLIGGAAAVQYQTTLDARYSGIKISVNGQIVEPKNEVGTTVEPFSVDGTTYLPVRALANAMGYSVDWDAGQNMVMLTELQAKAIALHDVYGFSDAPRLDFIIGQDAYYDCMVLDDGAHCYMYNLAYTDSTYKAILVEYAEWLKEIGYTRKLNFTSSNGSEYAIFENETSGYKVSVNEMESGNTSIMGVTVEEIGQSSGNSNSSSGSTSKPSGPSSKPSDSTTTPITPEPEPEPSDTPSKPIQTRCEYCDIELRKSQVYEDGTMVLECRNPKCTHYGRPIYIAP